MSDTSQPKQPTISKGLIAAIVILALVWIARPDIIRSAVTGFAGHESAQGRQGGTISGIRQKVLQRGYASLTPEEKKWTRDLYINDLAACDRILQYRYTMARASGQARIANEIKNSLRLVREAAVRLEADPDLDPTTDIQQLLNDVREALQR
jgi:hypothetical protein